MDTRLKDFLDDLESGLAILQANYNQKIWNEINKAELILGIIRDANGDKEVIEEIEATLTRLGNKYLFGENK